MKTCPQCGAEYRDDIVQCADDGAALVVSVAPTAASPVAGPSQRDTRRFVRIGTAEDPLSADQLVAALGEAKITGFARPRSGGSVDGLTSASAGPWWEIVAPEESEAQAREILERERAAIEASAEEAARAAEEEEAEDEARHHKGP